MTTTVKKLTYGTEEIVLTADADTASLRGDIDRALTGRSGSSWVLVPGKHHSRWVLVVPGVPVILDDYEREPARAAVVY